MFKVIRMSETSHYIERGCISPYSDTVFAGENIAVIIWVFKESASPELK